LLAYATSIGAVIALDGSPTEPCYTIAGSVFIEPTDLEMLLYANQNLVGLYTGWSLPDAWLSLPSGVPWDVGHGVKPNPNNGHCMLIVDRLTGGRWAVETWGEGGDDADGNWTGVIVTDAGLALACDEVYAAISAAELNGQGRNAANLDWQAMQAALQAA
jgi:hypothetical protein